MFIPHITRAKELIERGFVGKVFWIRSREAHFDPHSAWFREPELAGGGVLMDMGCHSIEVARYLIDKRPVRAYAWGTTLVHETRPRTTASPSLATKAASSASLRTAGLPTAA